MQLNCFISLSGPPRTTVSVTGCTACCIPWSLLIDVIFPEGDCTQDQSDLKLGWTHPTLRQPRFRTRIGQQRCRDAHTPNTDAAQRRPLYRGCVLDGWQWLRERTHWAPFHPSSGCGEGGCAALPRPTVWRPDKKSSLKPSSYSRLASDFHARGPLRIFSPWRTACPVGFVPSTGTRRPCHRAQESGLAS